VVLSILSLVAWIMAEAGPEAAPLEGASPSHRQSPAAPLPPDGASPLEGPSPAHQQPPASPLPSDGAIPLAVPSSTRDDPPGSPPPEGVLPLGVGPAPIAREPLDPALTRLVRVDFMVGPVWRIRPVDTMLTTSVEVGRMRGFSATFHTSMIVVSQRNFVRAFDFPIGFGAVARGRLRNKPLYGSVGLTAGILVHRAATGPGRNDRGGVGQGETDQGVIHRVDPDFRLPIRFAWTLAGLGASLALIPGYSVRERVYERRGAEVLNRHSFRIGLVLGLHWDLMAGRAKARRHDRQRDG
jgi:hypothetical protein